MSDLKIEKEEIFTSGGTVLCPFCGHSWEPRRNVPKQCPACKRYLKTYYGLKEEKPYNLKRVQQQIAELTLRVERLEQMKNPKDIESTLCDTCAEYHIDVPLGENCAPTSMGLVDGPDGCAFYSDKRLRIRGDG